MENTVSKRSKNGKLVHQKMCKKCNSVFWGRENRIFCSNSCKTLFWNLNNGTNLTKKQLQKIVDKLENEAAKNVELINNQTTKIEEQNALVERYNTALTKANSHIKDLTSNSLFKITPKQFLP